ncbi:MAG TPA: amidohydrolase family protein [Xanthobacteraceae bacterium]|nr:amidohydrolase family protein [Xanthobacteraceae bacterium]
MIQHPMSRRSILKGATAAGALLAAPHRLLAQTAPARSAKGPATPLPPRGEFVIRGATVLTMDPKIDDLATGDVHVRDGAIVAVAAKVDAPKAQVIEGRGMICMPGFVDTHWHLWTGLFRPFVRADVNELGYFPVSNRLGQLMTPEDSYRAVILGTAEALSAGCTTVHNWAHNIRSPDHADGELAAMRDAGIRGRLAYGPAQGMPDDQPMDFAGIARVQKDWMPNDGMLTLGICSRNVGAMSIGGAARGVLTVEQTKRDWDAARKLGLPITLHTSGPSPIMQLAQADLLGNNDLQLIHALLTTPEERALLVKHGVSYSMAPTGEARRPSKVGVIQLGELLRDGVKISLSTDHTTNYNCDPFVAMRILFALHQHRIGDAIPLTVKRLVQLATLDGAVDLGIADKTGSLTPGKRADIILVRTTDINMTPVGDPYEALVSLAQPNNVDTVIVDGRVLRQSGKFTALDHAKVVKDAQEAAATLRARAKWPA